jgi:hypothetical protein
MRRLMLERVDRRLAVELPQKELAVQHAVEALKVAVLDLHEFRDIQNSVKRELRIIALSTGDGDGV